MRVASLPVLSIVLLASCASPKLPDMASSTLPK